MDGTAGSDASLAIAGRNGPHAIRCWMGGTTPREELASLDLLGIEGDLDGWLEQLAEPEELLMGLLELALQMIFYTGRI
jgi:hypothetical protein|uniref:Uncharacterized protein n=1 Tax=Picea glauca TaxID=3330 RepID=A0A101LTV7_PICGL|nr:hypothetical protein ABT39_MTgene3490 [Picea glauca]QHR89361.1 hypothetical protein Q903MT_gene3382 [Picea sitchensis]